MAAHFSPSILKDVDILRRCGKCVAVDRDFYYCISSNLFPLVSLLLLPLPFVAEPRRQVESIVVVTAARLAGVRGCPARLGLQAALLQPPALSRAHCVRVNGLSVQLKHFLVEPQKLWAVPKRLEQHLGVCTMPSYD